MNADPPRIPTGQELYDAIMGHIEPELTTAGLLTLVDKYKSETPAQFEERKKRYAAAYQRYDQAYQGYLSTLQSQVDRYRKTTFDRTELEDRAREEGILHTLSNAWL